jgi:hypothetical protein
LIFWLFKDGPVFPAGSSEPNRLAASPGDMFTREIQEWAKRPPLRMKRVDGGLGRSPA